MHSVFLLLTGFGRAPTSPLFSTAKHLKTRGVATNTSPLSAPAAAPPWTTPTPTLRKSWAASPGVRRRGWRGLSGESVRPHDVLGQLLVVLLIRPV